MAKEIFCMRMEAAVKDALAKAAKEENRTVSGLSLLILKEWLNNRKTEK